MIRPLRSSGSSNVQTAAILIGVVAVLYLAREILVPLAFAIVLTFVLAPAVAGLRKLRIGRVPAVLLVMVVTVAVAAGISFVILNQLIQVVNDLPSYRENIDRKIQVLHTPNKGAFERAAQSVKEIGKEIASAQEPVAPPQHPKSAQPGPLLRTMLQFLVNAGFGVLQALCAIIESAHAFQLDTMLLMKRWQRQNSSIDLR
jgi:predicted PurR-regulated permease PerM